MLHVVRQVRVIDGKQVFALPKRNKTRDVPLAASVLRLVDEHIARFEPPAVTLPWRIPSGDPTTVRLLLTDDNDYPMWRNRFNDRVWNPERRAAGVTSPTRQDGTHALRHHYASVLLDAWESIKALSEYWGSSGISSTWHRPTVRWPPGQPSTHTA